MSCSQVARPFSKGVGEHMTDGVQFAVILQRELMKILRKQEYSFTAAAEREIV